MGSRIRLRGGVVDLLRGEFHHAAGVCRLSSRELDLLGYLVAHPGRVVSRQELLTAVWHYHPDSRSRAVDKTMNRLRARVELDSAHPDHLLTVFGDGYRFAPLGEPTPYASAPGLAPELDPFVGRVACWTRCGAPSRTTGW